MVKVTMTEVLEIEQIEAEQKGDLPRAEKDTWILRLPAETCQREGFAEGTMVSLTIRNHGIEACFIRPPSQKLREISSRLLEKNKELYAELKRLGD